MSSHLVGNVETAAPCEGTIAVVVSADCVGLFPDRLRPILLKGEEARMLADLLVLAAQKLER